MEFKPHRYQERAIQHVLDNPAAGLFLDMGLGKTVITLTAVERLMCDRFEITKVLVVAPLNVARTVWEEEARKWDHLRHLRFSKVLGSADERRDALHRDADVYVINRENLPWLVERFGPESWPFDMVVLDELSSFKSPQAQRFRAMRLIRPRVSRVVGLTGTPAPNGLIDLWSQVYLLDRGERLGKTLGGYRERYFTPGRRNGYVVYDWRLRPDADKAIFSAIEGLCISMRAEDYLDVPERSDHVIWADMPQSARQVYDALRRECVAELDGGPVMAATAAVVTGKLLQVSNGAVYGEDRAVHQIHDGKLAALSELVEAANGQPVIVFYAYAHDKQRIMQAFPQARALSTADDVKKWNAGELPMLVLHPASAGHGLNLQKGGHIVLWFGLTYSLELYQQANARLHRQGQEHPVQVYHILTRDTMDERVMQILRGKEEGQNALIDAVKAELEDG